MVVGATKLTADSWSSVVDDVYNQPTKKRPYYYVHNQNDIFTSVDEDGKTSLDAERNSMLPTNLETDKLHTLGHTAYATDDWGKLEGSSNFARTFDFEVKKKIIIDIFEERFPDRCSFEI